MMALSVGVMTADAGQRDRNGRDRNGRQSDGQVRERDSAPPQADGQERRGDSGQDRSARPAPAPDTRSYDRGRMDIPGPRVDPAPARPQNDNRDRAVPRPRGDYRDYRTDRDRDNDRYRDSDRNRDNDRYRNNGGYRDYRNDGPNYRYYGSRPAPRHYYGPGGNFSVYFGWGNGYLFGSRYSGRVYGYTNPGRYGSRVYFGDVRLQVRPRNAAVYVDGYYAGIVDNFDGVFQRLTLEVGPHTIELDAPGMEPQFFDVYVDPTRTIDIHADLYRY